MCFVFVVSPPPPLVYWLFLSWWGAEFCLIAFFHLLRWLCGAFIVLLIVVHINWLLDVKPTLYFWDKFHSIMVNFYTFWDLIWKCLVDGFCIHIFYYLIFCMWTLMIIYQFLCRSYSCYIEFFLIFAKDKHLIIFVCFFNGFFIVLCYLCTHLPILTLF